MNRTALPGLYVHTPFCKTKCPYCDFYSVTETGGIRKWVSAVLVEASRYRDAFPLFDSLYIGGGTPSVMNHDEIERLLEGLSDIFRFDDTTELTMELNPDDVTREKLAFYRSLGVNRISLGVQSFSEQEVRFLGRRHTARQAQDAVSLVAQGGFAEFGFDLMYGLPRQSTRTWLQTLRKALSFEPAHLSCYQLTIEGDTPFSRLSRGGNLPLPNEARQAALFLETSSYLTGAGFIHYEISNFARSEKTLSRHNVKYWQHTPYLGLGPAAHSFAGTRRWWNVRSLDGYLRNLDEGAVPVGGSEELSAGQMHLERMLFGFRTRWGVEASEISSEASGATLKDLCDSGLIELHDKRIFPTVKGYLFADRLPLMVSA